MVKIVKKKSIESMCCPVGSADWLTYSSTIDNRSTLNKCKVYHDC